MARSWRKWLLVVGFLPLLALAFDRCTGMYWLGRTELEVEFAVLEVATDEGIRGACIKILPVDGFYEEHLQQPFELITDESGVAHKEFPNCMSFGTSSGLGFTDSFHVHPPGWQFTVSAVGFEPSEQLDVRQYRQQVRRAGRGKSRLVVPVFLSKSHNPAPLD